MIVLILIAYCFLGSLPLWAGINLICLAFNLNFHLTIFQSFAICLFVYIIKHLFFNKKEDK